MKTGAIVAFRIWAGRAHCYHMRDGGARRRGPRCRTRSGAAAQNRHERLRNHALGKPGAHACWWREGREDEVLRVFAKWCLDAVIVGTVEPEPRLRIPITDAVADIPNRRSPTMRRSTTGRSAHGSLPFGRPAAEVLVESPRTAITWRI